MSLALVGLAALAVPARADTRTWVSCTPGALRSCASVTVGTIPVMNTANTARIGTALTVTVTNLAGSGMAGTSNGISGLYGLTFYKPVTAPIAASVKFPVAVMSGTGASGALTWQAVATYASPTAPQYALIDLRAFTSTNSAISNKLLGGCGTSTMAFGSIGAGTCGLTASATFAFQIAASIDAGELTTMYMKSYAQAGSADCYTNPAAVPFKGQACDQLVDPLAPVPEPATIALLGTGLAGVGVRLKRRRRDKS